MRKLRILSAAILQAIVALSAALSSTNASAATPIPSGIYSYEDIGETGTVNIAFNNKGELWFYAFVINEDGHTAELTPENGAWIPMKGNKFSYNLKTDILDYTLEGEFFPDEQLLELKDNFNAGGTPFGMGMGLSAHYRYEEGSFADRVQKQVIVARKNAEWRRQYMDWKMTLRHERNLGREEGREEGILIDRIEFITRKVKRGMNLSAIADVIEMDQETIRPVWEAVREAAPDYDQDEILRKLLPERNHAS